MEAIELIELIARGEDSRTQFKQDVRNPESLAGDLVAFSNSKGGKIIIGVSDQGVVVWGCRQRTSAASISCFPTPLPISSVHQSTQPRKTRDSRRPTRDGRLRPGGPFQTAFDSNGVFWVKSGSDKRRVTSREEIQRLLQSADLVHVDEVPKSRARPSETLTPTTSVSFSRSSMEARTGCSNGTVFPWPSCYTTSVWRGTTCSTSPG